MAYMYLKYTETIFGQRKKVVHAIFTPSPV